MTTEPREVPKLKDIIYKFISNYNPEFHNSSPNFLYPNQLPLDIWENIPNKSMLLYDAIRHKNSSICFIYNLLKNGKVVIYDALTALYVLKKFNDYKERNATINMCYNLMLKTVKENIDYEFSILSKYYIDTNYEENEKYNLKVLLNYLDFNNKKLYYYVENMPIINKKNIINPNFYLTYGLPNFSIELYKYTIKFYYDNINDLDENFINNLFHQFNNDFTLNIHSSDNEKYLFVAQTVLLLEGNEDINLIQNLISSIIVSCNLNVILYMLNDLFSSPIFTSLTPYLKLDSFNNLPEFARANNIRSVFINKLMLLINYGNKVKFSILINNYDLIYMFNYINLYHNSLFYILDYCNKHLNSNYVLSILFNNEIDIANESTPNKEYIKFREIITTMSIEEINKKYNVNLTPFNLIVVKRP